MPRQQLVLAVDRFDEWATAIEDWLAWLRSGALRAATLDLRTSQLRRFGLAHRDRGPFELSTTDVAAWISARGWQAETIRSHRAALRSFYGWAHDSGITGTNPARLLRKVPAAPVRVRPAPERAIDDALAGAGPRLALMLMLGSRHGLRRAEIAGVHTRDLVQDLDGWTLEVHGKGGKDRDVPLLPAVAAALRALPAGYAFPSPRNGHLTPAHVGKLLRQALSASGDRVTAHQLRHRFADVIYRKTNNLVITQELMGHASPATTRRYIHPATSEKRAVAATAA